MHAHVHVSVTVGLLGAGGCQGVVSWDLDMPGGSLFGPDLGMHVCVSVCLGDESPGAITVMRRCVCLFNVVLVIHTSTRFTAYTSQATTTPERVTCPENRPSRCKRSQLQPSGYTGLCSFRKSTQEYKHTTTNTTHPIPSTPPFPWCEAAEARPRLQLLDPREL